MVGYKGSSKRKAMFRKAVEAVRDNPDTKAVWDLVCTSGDALKSGVGIGYVSALEIVEDVMQETARPRSGEESSSGGGGTDMKEE